MSGGFEIALWILLIVATATDLLWGKIYNSVTFPFLVAGIVSRGIFEGIPSASAATLSVAVAFVLFFPFYALKVFAAGDVKLLMAIGAWTDTAFVLRLAALSILVGACVGVFVLIKQKGFKKGGTRMPFAPAFLCGCFLLKIFQMKGWNVL